MAENGGMNGSMEHASVDIRGVSIQQSLATHKVIQLKIDNPFMSNGEIDDETDDPFCIKPSKSQNSTATLNGEKENANGQDGNSDIQEKDAEKSLVYDPKDSSEADVKTDATKSELAPLPVDDSLKKCEEVMLSAAIEQPLTERQIIDETEVNLSSAESSMDSEISKDKDISTLSSDHSNEKTDPTENLSADHQKELSDSKISYEFNLINEESHASEKTEGELIETSNKILISSDERENSNGPISVSSHSSRIDLNDSVVSIAESGSEISISSSNNSDCVMETENVTEEKDCIAIKVSENKGTDGEKSSGEDCVEVDKSEKIDVDFDSKNSEGKDCTEVKMSETKSTEDSDDKNLDKDISVENKLPETCGKTSINVLKDSYGDRIESRNIFTNEVQSKSENQPLNVDDVQETHSKQENRDDEMEVSNSNQNQTLKSETDAADSHEDSKIKEDGSDEFKQKEFGKEHDKNLEKIGDEGSEETKIDIIDRKIETKDEDSLDKKSVQKVKDIDGSDILITINEEESDKEEDTKKQKMDEDIKTKSPEPTRGIPKIKSSLENDVVIVDLSDVPDKEEKPLPTPPPKQVVYSTPNISYNPGKVSVGPGGQQYIQHIVHCLDGRKQIIQVPVTTSSILTKSSTGVYSSLMPQALAGAAAMKKTEPEEPVLKPEDLIPQASWEQLALVQWESMNKKFDNTFWAGQCPVKNDLSNVTKFLLDLGSDIVKQSAYGQIVHVQGKKSDEGKLNDQEQANLERMKKVVKDLREKYKHLDLKRKTCEGCGFVTESENVMRFHREHPHMDPPLDSYGKMKCSFKDCDFQTGIPQNFAFHMEAEHGIKARIYDKPEPYQCPLCYYESKTKNQLTKHKFKCCKAFKQATNLHPTYTDISYCLKNVMYRYQVESLKNQNKNVLNSPRQPGRYKPAEPYVPPVIRPKSMPTNTKTVVTNGVTYKIAPPQTPILAQHLTGVVPGKPGQVMAPAPMMAQRPVLIQMPQNQNRPPTVGELIRLQNSQMNAARPVLIRPQVQQPIRPPIQNQAGFEVCEICGGYVKDRMSLQIHFFYAHKVELPTTIFQQNNPQFKCNICKSVFWTAPGLTKHKQSMRHFDSTYANASKVDSKCWICFQMPENLYNHLHDFHRLTTSDCMVLRRCMFCGVQTKSRKDLEMHMAAAHGVLVKGTTNQAPSAKSQAAKPQGLVRNNFCVFCSKQYPDNTQLTLHCLRDHATCSGCGMVVAKATDLARHVCKSAGKKCIICGLKNLKPAFYNKHIRLHMKKCTVKLKRLTEKEIERAMGKERKAKMDLDKQRELFTKLESDIWDEIQSRKKRDEAMEESNKRKRKSDENEKVLTKKSKMEEEIVVVE